MNRKEGTTLAIWIGLLLANAALLSLGWHAWIGIPEPAGEAWLMFYLLVGVIVFPLLALALLLRRFRAQPVRQWTAATMLLWIAGVLLFGCHLFLATLWMTDRTDALPQGLARNTHTFLSYGYTVFAPLLAVVVPLLWATRRGRPPGLRSL